MHSQAAGGAAHQTPGGFDLWNEPNGSSQLLAKFLAKVFLAGFFGRYWYLVKEFLDFGWCKMIWCFGLLPQPGGASSLYLVGVSYASPCQTPQHPYGRAAGVQDTTVVLGFWWEWQQQPT